MKKIKGCLKDVMNTSDDMITKQDMKNSPAYET